MLRELLFSKENTNFNFPLLFAVLFLIVLGLIMISSVSVFESYTVTQELVNKGILEAPSNDFYLIRSIVYTIVGLIVGAVAMFVPALVWERLAKTFFVISLILLLMTFTGFGNTLGGATAWIDIPGLPSIQPVEIYKLGFILYLATWLNSRAHLLDIFEEGFLAYFIRVALFLLPIALQPDFGSILILLPISVLLYLYAGGRMKYILYVGVIGLLMSLIVMMSFPYIKGRIGVFLDPSSDPSNRGVGWQIEQSLIAVGSGGFLGRGVGNSIQKYGYLPEVQGDTIFAALAEELGFIRLLPILFAFALIAYQGTQISMRSRDGFSALVTAGVTSWITIQAIINILVTLNLFPLTGITLPFISYGGSSLVSLCLATGILLSLSRDLSPVYEDHFDGRRDLRSRYTNTYSGTHPRRKLLSR